MTRPLRFPMHSRLRAFFLLALLSPGSVAAAVAVKVRVHDGAGKSIRGAYIALVPAWRPTSRPLAEAIAESDVTTLSVPSGDYRLIAGAPGHAVWSRQPITVASEPIETSISLPNLRNISGIVMDDAGQPIGGASIRTAHGATAPALGSFSALAVKHLERDWSAITREDGRWTMAIPSGSTPLLIEAPGLAEEWRVVQENDPASIDVRLIRGASLQVTLDRSDADVVVTLARQSAKNDNAVPSDIQPRVWARWGSARTLRWQSLHAGTYAIQAKYPKPEFFQQAALTLGTIELRAGEEKKIELRLPAKRIAETQTSQLFISRWNRTNLASVSGVAQTNDGGARLVDTFTEDVMYGWVVHFRARDVRRPFAAINADEVFSTPPRPDTASDTEPPLATQHPRADAWLQLRLEAKDDALPRTGAATLRNCADDAIVAVPVEVKADGIARFTAPARCRTLVLTFPPFEAAVLEQPLQPGDQSLGELTLRRGGAAEVSVVYPDERPVAKALVRVTTVENDAGSNTLVAELTTDDEGRVRFSALPVERDLRFTAESSSGDRADAAIARIASGEQRVLDPLVILAPATIIAEPRIDRGVLQRFPAARISSVMLRPQDPARAGETQQRNTASEAGPVQFDRVHPGRWNIDVWVSVAGVSTVLRARTLDVESGKTYRIDDIVQPNVFEGFVKEPDGRGVAARVTLDENGRRPHFDSDERGVFYVVLQDKGPRMVAVARASDQGTLIPVGEIDFSDPARPIEIVIPSGATIDVRVRTNDKPVAGIVVTIGRRTSSGAFEEFTSRGRFTDEQGVARFTDVAPGDWTLSAKHSDGSRADKDIRAIDERKLSVTLELTEGGKIAGAIRDGGRPPAARPHVDCIFVGVAGIPTRANGDAAPDGAFVVELPPPPPKHALCSVTTAAGTVDAFSAVPGTQNDFTLSATRGELRIDGWASRTDRELLWLVTSDGRAAHLSTIASRLRPASPTLVLPALAAGEWILVRVQAPADLQAIANRMGFALPPLARVRVAPGAPQTISKER
jgi:hypothetical protein